MAPEKNPLEIYKILPQTNCGQCYLPSCLAFSAAVTSGAKKLADCPFVKDVETHGVESKVVTTEPYEIMRREEIALLQEQVRKLDLSAIAQKLGGSYVANKLVISCLGKSFQVDRQGKVTSECHTHAGLTIPLLSYIVQSRGTDPTGRWIPFRELEGGPPMNALFEQRGERRLQKLADNTPELFDDIVGMFSGIREDRQFNSDLSFILHPLPKIPVLFCYWKPEEDLGSKCNIFFDETADLHLPVQSLFELCIGMVMMFEKIALKHA